MTRREFERRYASSPEKIKAELIEGVVYMASPLFADHGEPHSSVIGWLYVYVAAPQGVKVYDNTSLRLDNDNEFQPDAMMRLDETLGGHSRVNQGYVEGVPELIVEIAASSASVDRHDKLRVYQRNGVREYIVWPVYDRAVEWFEWRDGEYVLMQADSQGIFRSHIFPGLWLNVNALLQADHAAVLATLQAGLAAPEHADFVAQLRAPAAPQG